MWMVKVQKSDTVHQRGVAYHWSCDRCGWRAVTPSAAVSSPLHTCTKPSSLRERKSVQIRIIYPPWLSRRLTKLTEHGLDTMDPLHLYPTHVISFIFHHIELVLPADHHPSFLRLQRHREQHGRLTDVSLYGLCVICGKRRRETNEGREGGGGGGVHTGF